MKIFNRNHIVSIELTKGIMPSVIIVFSNNETKKKEFAYKVDAIKFINEVKRGIGWI